MTKVFPKILEKIQPPNSNPLPSSDINTNASQIAAQSETILYMGGALLRKLYFKSKSTEER